MSNKILKLIFTGIFIIWNYSFIFAQNSAAEISLSETEIITENSSETSSEIPSESEIKTEAQNETEGEIKSESKSEKSAKSKNAQKSIFSLDTGYLFSGLKNNGWGLGLSYE